jgi:hypothetical protein
MPQAATLTEDELAKKYGGGNSPSAGGDALSEDELAKKYGEAATREPTPEEAQAQTKIRNVIQPTTNPITARLEHIATHQRFPKTLEETSAAPAARFGADMLMGNVVGGPLAKLAEAHVVPALKAIPWVGRAVTAIDEAPSLLGKVARGATVGGAAGGAEGLIRGRGLKGSAEEAGKGALFGGALGLALPAINRLGRVPTYPGASLPSTDEFYENRGAELNAMRRMQKVTPVETPNSPGAMLPSADEFYEHRAQDLMRRGDATNRLQRVRTTPFGGKEEGIVAPNAGGPVFSGNEGRPATWTNDRVIELAKTGNREAIAQAARRGMRLPENVRYVAGDPDFPRVVYNPREVTREAPGGTPIRDLSKPQTSSGRLIEIPQVGKPRSEFNPAQETERLQHVNEPPAAEPEAMPTEIKGITAPVKVRSVPREKPVPIEKLASQDEITDAEGLIRQEIGAMQSADRPGTYFDESEAGDIRTGSKQIKGGDWRGVKSGRDMYPWMKSNPQFSPAQLEKALRNKDSAMYSRAMQSALDFIRREKLSETAEVGEAVPGEEEFFPAEGLPPADPEGVLPGMGEHVRAQERGAGEVKAEGLAADIRTPRDISRAAGEMETKSPLFRGTEASPQREIFGGEPQRLQPIGQSEPVPIKVREEESEIEAARRGAPGVSPVERSVRRHYQKLRERE